MASLGQDLKRERELRGVTLKEISDATRINIRFLRDLEEDRFDRLPGRFFVKGILRSYARHVGLDEDAVLNNYYETTQFQEEQKKKFQAEEDSQPFVPRKTNWVVSAFIIFIGVLAVLSAVHFIIKGRNTQLIEEPIISTPPPARVFPSPVEVVRELRMDLVFLQETWIQVYADGVLQLDGIKHPGETASVTAEREFIINLGNAGGVSFSLNKHPGRPFGVPGAVLRDIRVNLDNYKDYLDRNPDR